VIWRFDLLTRVLLALAALVPHPGQVTLRIPLEPGEAEEVAVVTFDENRISAADLRRWMFLHENGRYATPAQGYYADCKPSDLPKLQNDIKQTEDILKELDSNDYPSELSDVVAYLKLLQSFSLWQAQQELAFLNSGRLPDSEYNGVDFSACRASNSDEPGQQCHQVFATWHNCVLRAMYKRLGHYPADRWNAFLDAYGIREHLESTID
jgi:hypothetical protein